MKKRIAIALLCLTLICAMTACNLADFEIGGLVGEILGSSGLLEEDHLGVIEPGLAGTDVNVSEQPDEPETNHGWEETWVDSWIEPDITTDAPVAEFPTDLFRGEKLTLLGYQDLDLGAENASASVVDVIGAQRNEIIASEYGIVPEYVLTDSVNMNNLIKTDVYSGAGDFDIVYQQMAGAATELAVDGCLYNVQELPWVDLNNSWWELSCMQKVGVGENLPLAIGAATPDVMLSTSLLTFNMDIVKDLGYGDIYQTVREGKWTLNEMGVMASVAYEDLNGDAIVDPHADRVGFAGLCFDTDLAFSAGAKADIVCKDGDNLPYSELVTPDRILRAYEAVYSICVESPSLYVSQQDYLNDANEIVALAQGAFESGRVLFFGTNVQGAIEELDADAFTLGVLPYPKLDESQEEYHSYVNETASVIIVPKSVRNPELSGYVLEGMGRVTESLSEALIEAQSFRNLPSAEAVEMLHLVLDTQACDFGVAYFYTGEDNGATMAFRQLLSQENNSAASYLKTREKKLTKVLDKLLSQFS